MLSFDEIEMKSRIVFEDRAYFSAKNLTLGSYEEEAPTALGANSNSNSYKPKWHRSQCCGKKWECACVAQTKQVRNDSGGRGALATFLGKFAKSEEFVGVAHSSAEQ